MDIALYFPAVQFVQPRTLGARKPSDRDLGNKEITLSTGETFVFYWRGKKKRYNAGVGVLIKKSKEIQFDEPDICDPRIMALNIKVKGLSIRLVNVYSHTNCDGSDNQKDTFYRLLKKASI